MHCVIFTQLKKLLFITTLLSFQILSAQNSFSVIVSDEETDSLIEGATVNVEGTQIASYTDSNGIATLINIPNGEQNILVSYLGYFKRKLKIIFPQTSPSIAEIKLEPQNQELEEVVIVSTRNDFTSEDLPTRVDVVNEEEVEERMSDKPSDVSHIVKEQPGVQVQRTSATGGTMNIRLQGMRGKYVQVLKDGFPLFGGFSNVIAITQIPPLDLRQVEIIKGPSSTLYGGDAIGGVINLISKTPSEKPVYDIMVNGETARAADAGVYASQKIKWFAFALTGTYRWQDAVDWDKDNYSETPRLHRYYVSPQLFFDLGEHAKLNIGAGYTHEYRFGGALPYIRGKTDSLYCYYEKNFSEHVTSNLKFEYDLQRRGKITLKSSFNYFMRDLRIPFYFFSGTQMGSATEINYHFRIKKNDVVLGTDFRTDRFSENKDSSLFKRNYNFITGGFFVQYLHRFNDRTTVGVGIRMDFNNKYKLYPLPNFAFKQKWNEVFSTRLNLGMGYKLPNVFQDETEEARFANVHSIADSIKPELSIGGTIDLNIKFPNFNGVFITINQMYFLTNIFNPLLPFTVSDSNCTQNDCEHLYYRSIYGYQRSIGIESSFKLAYRGFDFAITYNLTDNNFKLNYVKSIAPLTSKHIVSILAEYTIKNFSLGIDVYYYSPVKLTNGGTGNRIWEFGIVSQYSWKYFLLFANLENVFDIRQTSFGRVVQQNELNSYRPMFSEIYAPLEGRLFNAGIKIRLGALSKKYSGNEGVERWKGKMND